MYTYHFREWLMFFYFYCFFGWCFESAYVSLRKRRPVNRGFLHGPWLPLYGSGAITVLWLTLPFIRQPFLVYVTGMLGATVLELCTGEAMVRFFRVRYWDYSDQKFQYRGHICLSSSIAWGFLSLLMVYVVHKPIARLFLSFNEEAVSVADFLLTTVFTYDFAAAFRRAMDLRALLLEAEQLCSQLEERAYSRRRVLEAAAVFTKDALDRDMDEKRRAVETAAAAARKTIIREVDEKRRTAKERRTQALARLREMRRLSRNLEQLKEKAARHSAYLLQHNPTARLMTRPELVEDIRRHLKKS